MAAWTDDTKASTTFTNAGRSVTRFNLLIESTFGLLIGDGFTLDIDNSIATSSPFSNLTKN